MRPSALPVADVGFRHPWPAVLLGGLGYFLAVALPLWLDAALGRNPGVWPASAVGVVVLLLVPRSHRLVTVLVLAMANWSAIAWLGMSGFRAQSLLVLAHVVGELGTVLLLERRLGGPPDLERTDQLAWFALLTGFISLPAAAMIGGFVEPNTTWGAYGRDVLLWWLPEATFTLLLVPALLHARRVQLDAGRTTGPAGIAERVALVAMLLVGLRLAFYPWGDGGWGRVPLGVAVAPALIWSTVRLGVGGTAWLVVLTAVGAVTVTIADAGPFLELAPRAFVRVIWAQLYALITGLSYLLLSAELTHRRRLDRERRAILDEVRRGAARLSAYFDEAANPVIVVDRDGMIVAVTPRVREFGQRVGSVGPNVGDDVFEASRALPSPLAEVNAAGWRRALDGASSAESVSFAPGSELRITWTTLRHPEHGILGASATIDDLSRLREEAEAMDQGRRLETVGRLAGGVAHDFNNILTVILGHLGLLEDAIPPGDGKQEDVRQARAAASRAVGLTRQLLAYARRQVVEPRRFDLGVHLAGLESMLRRLLGEDITLVVERPPQGPMVDLDPTQVDQIVVNLAVNARDAMPRGGRILIRLALVEVTSDEAALLRTTPGTFAELTIADEGDGVPPDVLARIFEPFYTTKGPGRGTGLGLSTVDGISRQSGGAVTVRSAVGAGTQFRVLLPAAAGDAARAGRATPTGGMPSVGLSGARAIGVLLCEDEPALRSLLARQLEAAGCRVLAAADADEALALARAVPAQVEVLLTDVVLSGLSGPDLAEALRAERPRLPVVFITGHAEQALIDRGIALSGHRLVQKPFAVREVVDALEAAVRGAS